MSRTNITLRILLIGLSLLTFLLGCRSGDGDSHSGASSQQKGLSVDLPSTLPIVDKVTFSPAAPTAGSDVQATVTTGYTLKHFQFRYDWLKNGVPVQDVEGPLFPGSLTAAGDVLKVKVTPYDEDGERKTFLSPYVVIGQRSSQKKLGDGYPCERDAQCASGSCGVGTNGMSCIGNAPDVHKDMALNAEMVEHLESETTLTVHIPLPVQTSRRSSSGSKRKASRSRKSSTGWNSSNDWASSGGWGGSGGRESSSGSNSSSSSSRSLGLGESCSQGGSCPRGLSCKGVKGMQTCAP